MGSFKVKRLNLKKSIIETFERQNFRTCKDVLCLTVLEIQSLFGITYKEALEILSVASEKCVSDLCTVYDLYMLEEKYKQSFFPTSFNGLDALLQGGLLIGSVTEMCGPPGVGKTQFCFLLSLLTTLAESHVIYIDTESTFSAQRIKRMALKKCPGFTEEDILQLLQHISVYRASTVSTLQEIIPCIEKEIIQKNVKLVIVDSIASLFRKEYSASGLQSVTERNNILVEQAALLKDMAQTYAIVIFITNQVTSHSANGDLFLPLAEETYDEGFLTDGSTCCEPESKRARRQDYALPALGVAWSHCINTRLVATFLGLQVCQLSIAKSPVAPRAAVKYTLNEAGFVLLEDDMEYASTGNTEGHILTKNHFLTEQITGSGIM